MGSENPSKYVSQDKNVYDPTKPLKRKQVSLDENNIPIEDVSTNENTSLLQKLQPNTSNIPTSTLSEQIVTAPRIPETQSTTVTQPQTQTETTDPYIDYLNQKKLQIRAEADASAPIPQKLTPIDPFTNFVMYAVDIHTGRPQWLHHLLVERPILQDKANRDYQNKKAIWDSEAPIREREVNMKEFEVEKAKQDYKTGNIQKVESLMHQWKQNNIAFQRPSDEMLPEELATAKENKAYLEREFSMIGVNPDIMSKIQTVQNKAREMGQFISNSEMIEMLRKQGIQIDARKYGLTD